MITKKEFKNIKCSELSLANCMKFAKRLKKSKLYFEPAPEVHPDDQVALTWSNNDGIINIAFDESGLATWAAYFPGDRERIKAHAKGCFHIEKDKHQENFFYKCLIFLHDKEK